MECSTQGSSSSIGLGSLNVLAPVLLYESYTAVIYSNVLLIIVLGCGMTAAVLGSYMCLVYCPTSSLSRMVLQKIRYHQHRLLTGEYLVKSSSFAVHQQYATIRCSRLVSTCGGCLSFLCPLEIHACSTTFSSERANIKNTDESCCTAPITVVVCLRDFLLLFKLPAVLLSGALSLYPGTLFAAIRLTQVHGHFPQKSGAPNAVDVSTIGLTLGVAFALCLLPVPAILYWVVTKRIACSFHKFNISLAESKQAYTWKYRVFTLLGWLEPCGRLFPSEAPKLWGPLVASAHQHWFWALSAMLSGWVMCAACLLQFHQEKVYCSVIFGFLSVVHVAFAVGLIVCQPKRSAALSVTSAFSCGVTSVVLLFTALTMYDRRFQMSDAVTVLIGAMQFLSSLSKSVAGFFALFGDKLHRKRRTRLTTTWQRGTETSLESKMAELKRRECRRRLTDTAESASVPDDSNAADDSSVVGPPRGEECDVIEEDVVFDQLLQMSRSDRTWGHVSMSSSPVVTDWLELFPLQSGETHSCETEAQSEVVTCDL